MVFPVVFPVLLYFCLGLQFNGFSVIFEWFLSGFGLVGVGVSLLW